jgi:hypothetical protein
VYEIASVDLGGEESEKRMARKIAFRLGRAPGVRACCGDTRRQGTRSEFVVTPYDDYEMRFLITRDGMGRQEKNGVCCMIRTMALLTFFQYGSGYARRNYTMESVEACQDCG